MSISHRSVRVLALAVLLAAVGAPCVAGCIAFTARSNAPVKVYLHSPKPVVFEIGKLGIPWRQITNVRESGHVLTWSVRKGRSYEVWDTTDYARTQLAAASKALGVKFAARGSLAGPLAEAIRRAGAQDQIALRSRLESALAAVLGIRIEVKAGVGGRLWPEYPLPVTSRFACATKGVQARFAYLTIPDSWRPATGAPRNANAKPGTHIDYVCVPTSATRYSADSPVIAWYDISYKGTSFRMGNAIEAQVGDTFDREAWVDTISENEVDLHVRLTSMLPIRNVTTEAYLPDGWTAEVSPKEFDVSNTKVITYRVTRPAGESPGLRIVGGTFHVGDYTTSKRVLTDHALNLGTATGVTGFQMIRVRGDKTEVLTVSDRQCRRIPQSGRMFFDVSPNFLPGKETYLTLDCTGSGEIAVEYRATSGKLCSAPAQTLDSGSAWRKMVFVLRDASFSASLPNKADFAIYCNATQMPGIAGVSISRFRTAGTE